MNRPQRIGRRSFLRGAGQAALAIPFLPSLARADEGPQPFDRHFVSFRIVNGFHGAHWYPAGEAVQVDKNLREKRLRDIPGPLSPLLDEGFDPLRDKINLLRHIDRLDGCFHNQGSGLLGWSEMRMDAKRIRGVQPSIDRIMASKVFGRAVSPLNLSVAWPETGFSGSGYGTDAGDIVFDPGLYPAQAYRKLFGARGRSPQEVLEHGLLKRATLNLVFPHYRAVSANQRLSRADRELLETHLSHLSDLGRRLARDTRLCTPPEAPEMFGRTAESITPAARAQIDIAVAALRCGLTNIVNIYFDPDHLMNKALHGVTTGHHYVSHEPNEVGGMLNAQKWYVSHLRDLLLKMDAESAPGEGGSLLDRALVLANNEIGNQEGQGDKVVDINHWGVDTQVMLAGGLNGTMRTGYLLDYRTEHKRPRYTPWIGTAYNRVLTTCMLAMGVKPDEWEQRGQRGYGEMVMRPALTPEGQVQIGDTRAWLPGLKKS